MKPLVDENNCVVNMRAIMQQDHEPMYLMQALQGAMVITSNEYLKRLGGDPESEEFEHDAQGNYLMLFQLIGVPTLNQKAREIPPYYDSLSSSGLFFVVTKHKAFFWIGQDYFTRYLDEETF